MHISHLREIYRQNKPEKEESPIDLVANRHLDIIIKQIKLMTRLGLWLPTTYYIREGEYDEQWYAAVGDKLEQLLLELGFAVEITHVHCEFPFSRCVIRDPKETNT